MHPPESPSKLNDIQENAQEQLCPVLQPAPPSSPRQLIRHRASITVTGSYSDNHNTAITVTETKPRSHTVSETKPALSKPRSHTVSESSKTRLHGTVSSGYRGFDSSSNMRMHPFRRSFKNGKLVKDWSNITQFFENLNLPKSNHK